MATVGAINLMINANASGVTRGVNVARNALMSLSSVVATITGATAGLTAEIMQNVNAYAEQESSLAKLEVLLGSQNQAVEKLGELQRLAAASPLSTNDVMQASSTLLSFGMNAEKLMPTMRMLADVSLGNSERFQSLSLAMAQVSAAGRLQGQDLLQLVNAGFNPLQVISENTGLSMLELKKRMEDGQISIRMVEEAFRLATSEGGRFENGVERMSKTVSGAMAKATDAIQRWRTSVGAIVAPEVMAAFSDFNDFMEKLTMGGNFIAQWRQNGGDATKAAFDALQYGSTVMKDAEEATRKQQEASKVLTEELEKADKIKKDAEAAKAAERAAEQAERQADAYARQAQMIREQIDPTQRLHREIQDIYKLVSVGALDSRTAQMAVKRAQFEFNRDNNNGGMIPTYRPGSVETAKYLAQKQLEKQNEQIEQDKKTQEVQIAIRDGVNKTNDILAKTTPIGVMD